MGQLLSVLLAGDIEEVPPSVNVIDVSPVGCLAREFPLTGNAVVGGEYEFEAQERFAAHEFDVEVRAEAAHEGVFLVAFGSAPRTFPAGSLGQAPAIVPFFVRVAFQVPCACTLVVALNLDGEQLAARRYEVFAAPPAPDDISSLN